MNKTDLSKVAKAATANAQSCESYLRSSYIQSKDAALADLITAAYYAGRASMAANIYDTESASTLNLSGMAAKLLDECLDCVRYFM